MRHRSWLLAAVVAGGLAAPALAAADAREDIRKVLETESRMYEVYDAALSPSVYAPKIIWQNPFGVRLRSEPEVRSFLTRLFTRPGFRAARNTRPNTVTDVSLLSRDTASAWSEETVEGQLYADGKPMAVRKSHILYALKRIDGRWLITDEMIMDEK